MLKSSLIIFRRLVWFFLAAFIAIVGIFCAGLAAYNVDKDIRISLIEHAEIAAAAIHSDILKNLSGSPADLTDEYYIDLKYQLSKIRSLDTDMRFVYVVGLWDHEVFFYADSEPIDSPDYSPPGQVYSEASEQLRQIFQDGIPVIEGPLRDRWGNWLSAFAPIRDVKTENTDIVAILGMDISNDLRQKQMLSAILQVIGLAILAELALLFYYFYLRRERLVKEAEENRKIRERQYEFVSMISHQLRTPISAARAAIEVLKDEKGFEILKDAYNKIIRLNGIVSTLLFFIENKDVLGQKQLITDKKADLVIAVNKQLDFFKKEIADKKISVNVRLPDKLILPIDEILLNRMIYSVIENAIVYNKKSGTIDISLKADSKRPILAITDSGYGIPAKEIHKIFKSFFRATNASLGVNEGSGLSLYIAKEIMRLLGGKITFESSESKGSTFYLYF